MFGMFSDKEMIDWIDQKGFAPHKGMDGKWYLTAHSNRECWGRGDTFRECMVQVLSGTGPDKPDK